MRYLQALYLCKCHAYGWQASDEGLMAVVLQILERMRLPDGRMHWQQ